MKLELNKGETSGVADMWRGKLLVTPVRISGHAGSCHRQSTYYRYSCHTLSSLTTFADYHFVS